MNQLAQTIPAADVRPVRQIMEGEARVLGKTRATLLAAAVLIICAVVAASAPNRRPRARKTMFTAIHTGFTMHGPYTRTPGLVHTHPLKPCATVAIIAWSPGLESWRPFASDLRITMNAVPAAKLSRSVELPGLQLRMCGASASLHFAPAPHRPADENATGPIFAPEYTLTTRQQNQVLGGP